MSEKFQKPKSCPGKFKMPNCKVCPLWKQRECMANSLPNAAQLYRNRVLVELKAKLKEVPAE